MIPAEAVEAAAKGLFALEYAVRSPAARWSLMGAETRARYCEMALTVLEAAAPYMLAEAWDEGWEEGHEAGRDRGTPEQPNPYRGTSGND